MTVTPVQNGAPVRQSDIGQQALTSNFDTFLTLLTTQLRNQDPLSPMDSNQFTQQLVEFSGVEQQINANRNLESLIALGQRQSGANAVGYLGKTITLTDGTGALASGEANWSYTLPAAAQDNVMTVTDSTGKVVWVGHGEVSAGDHTFTWDGKDNSGNQLSDGAYTLSVAAVDANGQKLTTPIKSTGVVSEIDLTGVEPMLVIAGGVHIPLSQAGLISNETPEDSMLTAANNALAAIASPLTTPVQSAMSLLTSL